MISGLDPTKVDWNNSSVVYLMKYFEAATKARDEEIEQLKKQTEQLKKQIAHLIEENDQLKSTTKAAMPQKALQATSEATT